MRKEIKTGYYIDVTKDSDVKFKFYTDLSVSEKVNFVNSVTDYIVMENSYNYIMKDLMFDYNLLLFFTDIDLSDIKDSVNILDSIEEFIENTNATSIVISNMEKGLYENLKDAVDRNIEYRTGIHEDIVGNSLKNLFKTFETKISNIDEKELINFASKISGIKDELTVDKITESYIKSDAYKKTTTEIKNNKNNKDNLNKELTKITNFKK